MTAEDRENSAPAIVVNRLPRSATGPVQRARPALKLSRKGVVVGIVGNINHLGPEIARARNATASRAEPAVRRNRRDPTTAIR